MNDDARPPARHEFEHEVPTVIHKVDEEDMTALARWLHRGLQQGPKFWYYLAGTAVAALAVLALVSSLSQGSSAEAKAWDELTQAKTADERVEIADAHKGTTAAHWAKVQAASEIYAQAFQDLPANRDAALPRLSRALKLFREVAEAAAKDAPAARVAALGAARTLEARNELGEAIAQYESVASAFPGTPEADDAARLAKRLKTPEAVDFYKQLYAFKPSELRLPPGGQATYPLPSGHPALDGPTTSAPALPGRSFLDSLAPPMTNPAMAVDVPSSRLPPAPPEPVTIPGPPKVETPAPEPRSAELPADPFAPAPKPEPEPARPTELPADPFAPAPKS